MTARGVSCAGTLLAGLLTVACTTTTQLVPTDFAVAATGDGTVMAMVRQALETEPTGTAPASLFAVGVTFVANAVDRTSPPRYAGIGRGGSVRVTGLSGEVIPPYAFAIATYRWDAADGSAAEIGRATFLLQRIDGSWRIRHVHSSMVLPWEGRS